MCELMFPIPFPHHQDDPALIEMAREMAICPVFLLAQLQEWKEEEEGMVDAGCLTDGRYWLDLENCTWVFSLIYRTPGPMFIGRPLKTSVLNLEYPVPIPSRDDDPALLEMARAMEGRPEELRAQLVAWEKSEDHKDRIGLRTVREWSLSAKGCEWEFGLLWRFAPDGTLVEPCSIFRVFVTHGPPDTWKEHERHF